MFWPFFGWAIIRLRLEYRRKLIYCNVDIKNGETRFRFTMFGEVCSKQYIRDVKSAMVTTSFVVSSVGSSTRGLESSFEVALESVDLSVLESAS
jgi:hypothetical protein